LRCSGFALVIAFLDVCKQPGSRDGTAQLVRVAGNSLGEPATPPVVGVAFWW
jgi:hypothetical protein